MKVRPKKDDRISRSRIKRLKRAGLCVCCHYRESYTARYSKRELAILSERTEGRLPTDA